MARLTDALLRLARRLGRTPRREPPAGADAPSPTPSLAEADALARQLEERPEDNATRISLAHLLFDCGQTAVAHAQYLEALRRADPEDPELFRLHASIGACLELEGKPEEAIRSYEQALALNAACVPAHWNLAELYRRAGNRAKLQEHERALAALELGPALRLRQALQMPVIAPSAAALEAWRAHFAEELAEIAQRCTGTLRQPESEVNATALYLAYQGVNEAPLVRELCRTIRRFYQPPPFAGRSGRARGRIRIGFVSPFFYNHSIGRLYRGLIRELDRRKFEVVVFSIDHRSDETARLIEALADRFAALPGRVETIADAVRAADLDVLYFPEIGLHPVPYYLAYWRLAPVQCVSYGHPATTGVDTIDYFLSAQGLEGPGAEEHYTEKLVRLPGFFMPAYERPEYPRLPKAREDFGARAHERVYFCPQTLFKLHPDFDAVLAGILRRDPQGVLTLIDATVQDWREALTDRFSRTMPDVCDRVRFIAPQATVDYFSLLGAADAVLDTLHFGGGISVMDTFAAGAPLVTHAGAFFRGRQAAACYREMGIHECIAATPEDYVSRALRMAGDGAFRSRIAAQIAANSPRLYGRLDSVRALEDFLEAAVRERRG